MATPPGKKDSCPDTCIIPLVSSIVASVLGFHLSRWLMRRVADLMTTD